VALPQEHIRALYLSFHIVSIFHTLSLDIMKLHCRVLMKVLELLFVFIFVWQTQNVQAQGISECNEKLGTGIEFYDCFDAEIVLWYGIPGHSISNFEGLQNFSLISEDIRTRLPRGAIHKSCEIWVDLENYAIGSLQTSWRQSQAGLRQLVTDCVKTDGKGGTLHAGGLIFMISNPTLVHVYNTCLKSPHVGKVNMKSCLQMQLGASRSTVLENKESAGTSNESPGPSASDPNSAVYPPLQPNPQRSQKLSRPSLPPRSNISPFYQMPMAGRSSIEPVTLPLQSFSDVTLDRIPQRAPQGQQERLESGPGITNRASSARITESETEKQDNTSEPRLFSWPPSDQPTGINFILGDRVVRYWLWAGKSGWVVQRNAWNNRAPDGAWQAVQIRKQWEVQTRFPREIPSPTGLSSMRRSQILHSPSSNYRCWVWKAVGGSWEPYNGLIPTKCSKPEVYEAIKSGWYLIKYDFKPIGA
jgi:hypothetical protein